MYVVEIGNYVTMASGEDLPIGELRPGDIVKGLTKTNVVQSVHKSLIDEPMWNVNGDLIRGISSDTLIYTHRGWAAVNAVRAEETYNKTLRYPITELHIGSKIKSKDGEIRAEGIGAYPSKDGIGVTIKLDGDHTLYLNDIVIHNLGGGDKPPPQPDVITQITEPPKFLKPFLTRVAEEAETAFDLTPRGGFQGDILAPIDPRQLEALSAQEEIARGLGPDFGQPVQDIAALQAQRVLSGDILGQSGEEFAFQPQSADLAGVISAALDPVQERLLEQIIPGIQSAAIEAGAFGGTRQDVLTQQALREFGRTATDVTAELTFKDLARTEDQRLQDLISRRGLIPDLERAQQTAALTTPDLITAGLQQQLVPSELLGGVGASGRAIEQELLNAALQQFNIQTTTPFAGLSEFSDLLTGIPGGVSSTTNPAAFGDPNAGGFSGGGALSGALGGGLGAASLISAAPSLFGAAAPLAALGGPLGIAGAAILGGLLGGFG